MYEDVYSANLGSEFWDSTQIFDNPKNEFSMFLPPTCLHRSTAYNIVQAEETRASQAALMDLIAQRIIVQNKTNHFLAAEAEEGTQGDA